MYLENNYIRQFEMRAAALEYPVVMLLVLRMLLENLIYVSHEVLVKFQQN